MQRIPYTPHINQSLHDQLNNINKTAYCDLNRNTIYFLSIDTIETPTYLAPNQRQTLKHTLLHGLIQASSTGLAWLFHAYQLEFSIPPAKNHMS